MARKQRIYLAGPGVFFPDPAGWGRRLIVACDQAGMEGLYPLDQAAPPGLDAIALRGWIYRINCQLIRDADAVFADLRAFRSACEPDSGTAWEVGFAHALGKPVWGWLPDCTPGQVMTQRIPGVAGQPPVAPDGLYVEDFGAPLNLMLWESLAGISYAGEPEEALQDMARDLCFT
ncbi:nucleoside 2-deoxyribosyltransferase [Chitinilyticum litopenaei]|uniref:nucleoside 2-deoxyribosyltransferase n=1 Tax=Chitinilyticum litopenaei TaxID=1121276 RepID=UPI0003F96339|nr:nucleoside 2-deoxyribosyltransferase [Chitinilyticum litopenaei]